MHDWSNTQDWSVLLMLLLLMWGAWRAYRGPTRWQPSYWKHGTSAWCRLRDLKKGGFLKPGGLPIGRTRNGKVIWLHRNQWNHCAIFAPAGAGKFVSYVAPWALTWRGTAVFLDVKGEIYQATHAARRKMGQRIIRIDPYGVCGPGGDSINIFDMVGRGPECLDQLRAIFEAIIVRPPEGDRDPHWNDQALNILVALGTLIATEVPDEDRHLGSLRYMLSHPDTHIQAQVALMAKGGLFAEMGGLLSQLEEKEKSGCYSTSHRHTAFISSPEILATVCQSSFDVKELLSGNVSLYIILPPPKLEAQARFLRLIIAAVIRLLGEGGMERGKECLMVLDECGQLQYMPALEIAMTLMRGYGLKTCTVWQSADQLKSVFRGKEGIVYDNADVQVYFGTQSVSQAETVCKRLGKATVTVVSGGESQNTNYAAAGQTHGTQYSQNSSSSFSEMGRDLLDVAEVMMCDPEMTITFIKGLPPLLCRRILYYSDPLFRRRKGSWFLWLLLFSIVAFAIWAYVKKLI